jgi:hypothetical protein
MSVDKILNAKSRDGNCEKDAAEVEQSVHAYLLVFALEGEIAARDG